MSVQMTCAGNLVNITKAEQNLFAVALQSTVQENINHSIK
jgi:hypothetical protein